MGTPFCKVIETRRLLRGWNDVVGPSKQSGLQHIHCARILLSEDKSIQREANDHEHVLYSLGGISTFFVEGGKCFELKKDDAAFLPANLSFTVEADSADVDLVCFHTEGTKGHDIAFIPADLIRCTPKAKIKSYKRGEANVLTGRKWAHNCGLRIGVTHGSDPGRLSWPPHEHRGNRELLCLPYDTPKSVIALQAPLPKLPPAKSLVKKLGTNSLVIIPQGATPPETQTQSQFHILWAMARRTA